MKKTLLLLLIVIMLSLTSCRYHPSEENRPCLQHETYWKSECGRIEFTVLSEDDDYGAIGKMTIDGNVIEFFLTNALNSKTILYDPSVRETKLVDSDEDVYETWKCAYVSKDKFIAYVEETTYFEVGEKIVFHKTVDDSVSE